MAANLTPQYLEAEAEYKKAQTAEERLACPKKMYALVPKHKASEKLQAELKTKISERKRRDRARRKNAQEGRRQLQDPEAGRRPVRHPRRAQRGQEPAPDPADAGDAGSRAVSRSRRASRTPA